jgi:hypothetical protein
MSIGNLKDQGNKGNNFPYQLKTLQLLGAINDGISALPGVDHESRTSTYQAIANGVGYSIGDIIIRYDIIDLATGLIDTTIWFNDTLQTQLSPAPLPGDLTPISAPSGVTVLNGPAGAAVNIQDGGNSITVDATSLPLPTGAATETTLATILADATFTARINTLGQKAMAASTPVVLASDQSTLNITQVERTGVSGYTAAITGVAATDVIAAPGVGLFTYVTQILVTNSHATVGTLVTIQTEDGTGLYAGYAGPAGGGFSVSFTVPIKMPVANKKLQAICGTTGANVYVSASGYTAV